MIIIVSTKNKQTMLFILLLWKITTNMGAEDWKTE